MALHKESYSPPQPVMFGKVPSPNNWDGSEDNQPGQGNQYIEDRAGIVHFTKK